MRNRYLYRLLTCLLAGGLGYPVKADYVRPEPPFSGAAGSAGSEAIALGDERIRGWATGVVSYRAGESVDASWQAPAHALGPASGNSAEVLVLGRGGEVVMSFSPGIADGAGADFAVFENGFSDRFLELAWVEVSSDGIHFVRFPNYSYTAAEVGNFGEVDPSLISGFAGKYRLGFGTPFDLRLLELAYAHAQTKASWNGQTEFSQAYRDHLVTHFPLLDMAAVTQVRLIDIRGDGSALDCEGLPIFDPYPTAITAGFDLDGVAVLNEPVDPGAPQYLYHPPTSDVATGGTLALKAVASSGLPVAATLISAPEGTVIQGGQVIAGEVAGRFLLRLSQAGDATWAAAADILLEGRIIDSGGAVIPESFADYASRLGTLSGQPSADDDGDRRSDLLEFAVGTDPQAAGDIPEFQLLRDPSGNWLLRFSSNPLARVDWQYQLMDTEGNTLTGLPRLLGMERFEGPAGEVLQWTYAQGEELPDGGGLFRWLLREIP